MSQDDYVTSPMGDWQDLVAWDGELYDPMYTEYTQGNSLTPDYHLSESFEQPYLASAPPSLAGRIPSLDVSPPPSTLDGSFGRPVWTSPSLETTTTSPLVENEGRRYFGSFENGCEECDNTSLPLRFPQEPPILDTRFERIADTLPNNNSSSATEQGFMPHVAGSNHSFSGLDVRTSQVFTNIGTWAGGPQIVEPIAEADEHTEAVPIAIPYTQPQSFNDSFASFLGSVDIAQQYDRRRAATIPQARRHPASCNAVMAQSPMTHRVPPALSVSPSTYRRPRSATLSRSNSRTESRRKLATPSPTSDGLGWISYLHNSQTNRLAPVSTDGGQGRNPRGRKRALTAEQRSQAALMRVIGACTNCKLRKEKCDPGTPCRSCLEHYKGDLINHPCRDRLLGDQSSVFLSDRWHPTARPLESFLPAGSFEVRPETHTIPLYFGFGPQLSMEIHAIQLDDDHAHIHVFYPWPPTQGTGTTHKNAVLPAVLTKDAMANLTQTLDKHLSLLVSHHFRAFPLFCSPLRILRDVYVFSRSLPTNSKIYRTLHQALKLLVLVHIGGDITLPPPNSDLSLSYLVQTTMDTPEDITPTPCFIRSQFGKVMPGLADALMREVLSSLEQLLLNRDCDSWPMALAVMIVLLMTIESIHYHAAKLPYHNCFDAPAARDDGERQGADEESVRALLAFYLTCFAGCHARLSPSWEGEASSSKGNLSPEDTFVESVRKSIKKASSEGYISRKASETRQGDDMGFFFDRLVARLLLSKP